mmetsp:Transcript_83969/g.237919  ORF Transcript_83969/g.237919 Transcript_83969/m.237919 type:complete len:217 (+) Transcript_83969:503-1153(+)
MHTSVMTWCLSRAACQACRRPLQGTAATARGSLTSCRWGRRAVMTLARTSMQARGCKSARRSTRALVTFISLWKAGRLSRPRRGPSSPGAARSCQWCARAGPAAAASAFPRRPCRGPASPTGSNGHSLGAQTCRCRRLRVPSWALCRVRWRGAQPRPHERLRKPRLSGNLRLWTLSPGWSRSPVSLAAIRALPTGFAADRCSAGSRTRCSRGSCPR